MLRVLNECIVTLAITSHHVNLPCFEAKCHLAHLSSIKLCNLHVSLLESVLTFWGILSHHSCQDLGSVMSECYLNRCILIFRSSFLYQGGDLCFGLYASYERV